MNKELQQTLVFVFAACLLICSAKAAELSKQETILRGGMTLKSKDPYAREIGPGGVILDLAKSGFVKLKPYQRADYVDYRPIKKPLKLFGHTVVVIEEEYLTQYIGCCVNIGIGMVIEVKGDTSGLESFVKSNECRFDSKDNWSYSLENSGLKPKAGANYAYLSCREKDGPL